MSGGCRGGENAPRQPLFIWGEGARAAGAKRSAASPQTAGGSRASENPADGFADGMMVLCSERGEFYDQIDRRIWRLSPT